MSWQDDPSVQHLIWLELPFSLKNVPHLTTRQFYIAHVAPMGMEGEIRPHAIHQVMRE